MAFPFSIINIAHLAAERNSLSLFLIWHIPRHSFINSTINKGSSTFPHVCDVFLYSGSLFGGHSYFDLFKCLVDTFSTSLHSTTYILFFCLVQFLGCNRLFCPLGEPAAIALLYSLLSVCPLLLLRLIASLKLSSYS